MALYRALNNLDAGKTQIGRGEVFAGERIGDHVLERLLKLGRVALVSAPPLAMLPDWEKRAAKLKKIGVSTVEEFIAGEAGVMAKACLVSAERIGMWKLEVLECLKAPGERGKRRR
jgi:hypothetical protein